MTQHSAAPVFFLHMHPCEPRGSRIGYIKLTPEHRVSRRSSGWQVAVDLTWTRACNIARRCCVKRAWSHVLLEYGLSERRHTSLCGERCATCPIPCVPGSSAMAGHLCVGATLQRLASMHDALGHVVSARKAFYDVLSLHANSLAEESATSPNVCASTGFDARPSRRPTRRR